LPANIPIARPKPCLISIKILLVVVSASERGM